jgi:hypothetical protein
MSAPAIIGAIAKVMAEVGVITKGRKNAAQNYAFRGIDDVVAGVQEVMARNGVIVVPRVIERERDIVSTKSQGSMVSVRLLVEHTFMCAEDGSSVVCTMLGEAFDSGDKASNKAMSAALKYAITETFLIATYEKDRDTEEHSPQLAPPPLPSIPTVPMAPPAFAGERDSDRAASAAMDAVRRSAPSSTPPPPTPAGPPAAVPNSETATIGRERIAAAKNMAELAKVGTDLIKTPDWKAANLKEAFTRRQQELVSAEKAEAARGAA